jgi:ankyrin repeat protein
LIFSLCSTVFEGLSCCLQRALKRSQAQALAELHVAASAGDLDVTVALLAQGVPINASDYDMRTALVRHSNALQLC